MTTLFSNGKTCSALIALTLCAACGRGGNSGVGGVGNPLPDVFGPTASILFPGTRSTTDKNSIIVTGTAFDPSGVASLSVNGVTATTSNRFDRWRATVPLAPGENVFAISTTDLSGNSTSIPFAGSILNVGPFLAGSKDLRILPVGGEVLVIDDDLNALLGVDLITGHRRSISSGTVGMGLEFRNPRSIALYAAGQRALVLDPGNSRVEDVDLVTGDRSVLSSSSTITVASYALSNSIVVDEVGQRALVSGGFSTGPRGVFAISLLDGTATTFSNDGIGAGPVFGEPAGLDLDAINSRLFVVDEDLGALFSVDLATGDRTIVSSPFVGEGPVLSEPHSPRYDSVQDRVLLVDSDLEALIAVNLTSGDRSIVSDATHGTGPLLAGAVAVELDSALSRALVSIGDELISVDLLTGDRLSFSGSNLGFGPTLSSPSNAYGHLRQGTIIVQDSDPSAIPQGFELYRVDVNSGNRDIVATSTSGSGVEVLEQFSFECNRLLTRAVALGRVLIAGQPELAVYTIDLASSDRTLNYVFENAPVVLESGDIEFDGTNSLAFVGFEDQIWRVHLKLGTAELLSGLGVGLGPKLLDVKRITLDLAGKRLLVTDLGRASVIRVRLENGNRADVTGPLVGSGPSAGGILAVEIDARNRRVAYTDTLTRSVLLAELNNGNRSYLFNGDAPDSLFPDDTPVDLVIDAPRNVVYVLFEGALDAIMMIEMTTRERVIISR